jgi:hypothetical protein
MQFNHSKINDNLSFFFNKNLQIIELLDVFKKDLDNKAVLC